MLKSGKYLPCLCFLIKTWLILSSKVEKFNRFWMQHTDRIEQLFVHQCIWCGRALLTTVFPPSRTCAHITNFWRQAGFGNVSCYDEIFFCFEFFLMCLFNLFFSCARFLFFTAAILKTWSVHRQRIKTASFFNEMLYMVQNPSKRQD